MPEKAKQVPLNPMSECGWVDRSIWTDRMLAALVDGVRGEKWFSLIDKVYRPRTLKAAWEQVKSNKGSAGVDGQSIERFEAQAERYLEELSEALRTGSYQPEAVRGVDIPKGKGKTRPLGIPTVKDRIVQTAVKRVIEPIFEQMFLPMSHGFRPNRGCKDALREVWELLKSGHAHVVDADISNYFNAIPHERLMERLEERISDGRMLGLLESWLKQDVVKDLARWTPMKGTPQGAVISPLLANLYLHGLDVHMTQQGYRMVRYADDFVVLCRSAEEARKALAEIGAWMDANGLSLHPDKTHVGDWRVLGEGFDFLGYRFEAGKRKVRKKSLDALKDKIRARTRRTNGRGLEKTIAHLNPILRGWFGYFKHAARWILSALDQFVRRRLRAMLRKQEKRLGAGRCKADHMRWPNSFFAAAGLFTLYKAHQSASQSR